MEWDHLHPFGNLLLVWIACFLLCCEYIARVCVKLLPTSSGLINQRKTWAKAGKEKQITSFKIWKYAGMFCLDMGRCWQSRYLTLAPFHWVFIFNHMRGGMNPWCWWILDVVFVKSFNLGQYKQIHVTVNRGTELLGHTRKQKRQGNYTFSPSSHSRKH